MQYIFDTNIFSNLAKRLSDKNNGEWGEWGQPELRDFFCTIRGVPRRNRCILPELACHIAQRGVDRREVFSSEQDRTTYLRPLQDNLKDGLLRILGCCWMSNHVHLVAVPARIPESKGQKA